MKKYPILADIAVLAALGVSLVAPSFAAVISAPALGSAAGYPVLDSTTSNAQAKADAQNAYNQILAMGCTTDMTGVELNNRYIAPGAHCFSTGTVLNGQVFLDAKGDSNAVFVFKINSRFDVWANSTVILMNGTRPENVFWQVGGQVFIGSNVQFAGTVISLNSITLNGGTMNTSYDDKGIINGRLWSVGSIVSVPARAAIGFVQPVIIVPVTPYQPQPIYPQIQQGTGSYLTVSANDGNFALFVNGMRAQNGMRYAVAPGSYIVTEVNTSGVNYAEPTFSVGCAQNGLSGAAVVNPGNDITCVITNHPAYMGVWANPGMPNTGFGGSALPMLNILGLLIVTAFVWQETSSVRVSS